LTVGVGAGVGGDGVDTGGAVATGDLIIFVGISLLFSLSSIFSGLRVRVSNAVGVPKAATSAVILVTGNVGGPDWQPAKRGKKMSRSNKWRSCSKIMFPWRNKIKELPNCSSGALSEQALLIIAWYVRDCFV
jgi:hypothetical protein